MRQYCRSQLRCCPSARGWKKTTRKLLWPMPFDKSELVDWIGHDDLLKEVQSRPFQSVPNRGAEYLAFASCLSEKDMSESLFPHRQETQDWCFGCQETLFLPNAQREQNEELCRSAIRHIWPHPTYYTKLAEEIERNGHKNEEGPSANDVRIYCSRMRNKRYLDILYAVRTT